MNAYDSHLVSQFLLASGYVPAADLQDADVVLINTCAVRAKAEQKAFSHLGRILQQKRKNPDLIVGLMGCVGQQGGSELLLRFPGLDLVLGPRELAGITRYLHAAQNGCRGIVATNLNVEPPASPNIPGYFSGRVTSHLSIMEGCNNFCSYCVVPLVRGREASRSPEEILEEAKHLVLDGVKEITLLGQNVNSYCHGEGGGVRFPDLLRLLSPLHGLMRLRFTTSHPKDLSEDLIDCFVELPNLCPHIHLPFQAGSDTILRRMNRGYTREQYVEKVMRLREVQPKISITSDVMVGFPGETEEDFESTLELIKEIEFDNLYSFKYSERDGTRAASMEGKVGEREKLSRLTVLQHLQKEISLAKNKRLEGCRVDVLVEGPSRQGDQLTGRTDTHKVVNFNSDSEMTGHLVKVLIERSSANSLWGTCKK